MVPMLLSQPVRAAEREHRLKYVLLAPLPADVAAFKRRFAIPTLLTSWGGTEMSAPVIGEAVPGVAPGFAGHPRPGWEVRLVDEHDQPVPIGAVGEGIVRAERPFTMSSGYFGDDAATASAWRHGWFHTGDLLRADDSGALHFVDRTGDAIRRRGENVSAFEVEVGVATYPGITEVAAVPVASDSGVEHDIKAWVVAAPGSEPDWEKLLEHCAATMPHFMVPRYFELTCELPKSPSAKVQKYLLRERGNTADTWDSVAHGLTVSRHGLERTK
jgi:crotonobetaine/carnitine-CoA ligase